MYIKRPENTHFEGLLRPDVMVCTEIVSRFVRPSHSEVHSLDEDARPLPLDVHEDIYVRTVAVEFLVLCVECITSLTTLNWK